MPNADIIVQFHLDSWILVKVTSDLCRQSEKKVKERSKYLECSIDLPCLHVTSVTEDTSQFLDDIDKDFFSSFSVSPICVQN